MISMLIWFIIVIAFIAVVAWFLQRVAIPAPISYVIYAALAIIALIALASLAQDAGSFSIPHFH